MFIKAAVIGRLICSDLLLLSGTPTCLHLRPRKYFSQRILSLTLCIITKARWQSKQTKLVFSQTCFFSNSAHADPLHSRPVPITPCFVHSLRYPHSPLRCLSELAPGTWILFSGADDEKHGLTLIPCWYGTRSHIYNLLSAALWHLKFASQCQCNVSVFNLLFESSQNGLPYPLMNWQHLTL